MPCNIDLPKEGRARLLKVLDMIASPELIVDIIRSVISMFTYKFLRDNDHLSLGARIFVFVLICLVHIHAGKWIRRRYLTDKKVSCHTFCMLDSFSNVTLP